MVKPKNKLAKYQLALLKLYRLATDEVKITDNDINNTLEYLNNLSAHRQEQKVSSIKQFIVGMHRGKLVPFLSPVCCQNNCIGCTLREVCSAKSLNSFDNYEAYKKAITTIANEILYDD